MNRQKNGLQFADADSKIAVFPEILPSGSVLRGRISVCLINYSQNTSTHSSKSLHV